MKDKVFMQHMIELIDLNKLPPNEELEGPEPNDELVRSIHEFGVIYPVIISRDGDGNETIIDGRRRIKACRILELDSIKVIYYEGLESNDEATWALILNDQRSDNVITEYKYYSKLSETKDWQQLKREYGFNKNHVQKVLSLGKIIELETLTNAYEQGLVAESTLFEIAKLGEERQRYVMNVLETKGKVAFSDVKEAKQIKRKEAMASLQLTPVKTIPAERVEAFMYAVAEPDSNMALLFTNIQEAYENRDAVVGSRLFRLFEV
jgi:ParB family chromosome partitioning protein